MSNNSNNNNLYGLFARHPNYLLKLFFIYYPLSNELIYKFKNEIKWHYLSMNSNRKWDRSFIEENVEQLNWDALSANPSLKEGVKKRSTPISACFTVEWSRRGSNPRPNDEFSSFLHAYFLIDFRLQGGQKHPNLQLRF